MRKNNAPSNRITALKVFILGVFIVLFLRLGYVQIVYHWQISKMVLRLVGRQTFEEAPRGNITDTNGKILATSVRRSTIFLDPRQIKDFAAVKKVLATNGLHIKQNKLSDFGNTAYFAIPQVLTDETVVKIKAASLAGIGFETKYSRRYPEGTMVAHVLGAVGQDGKGASGLEQSLNDYLLGTNVFIKQTRDGIGNIVSGEIVDQEKISGDNVELAIDINIQLIVEQELKKAFLSNKAKKAVCIVQDPYSGAILAMVSIPDFSPSEKLKDLSLLRNFAVSDMFEPGSTFKIVAIAAALNEGKIKINDTFFLENGSMKIFGHNIDDDPNHKVLGDASIEKIMANSSNIGMVKIAQKLGKNLFYEYIRKFGYYSLTGIELPAETRGSLTEVRQWDAFSLPTFSFGQGLGVSALQIINSYSVIANGGILMKPMIVKKISGKGFEQVYEPKQIRRVISEKTALQVRKLLKAVVDDGTGKTAKILGYSVGGKTGTAQKYDTVLKRYSKQHYVASFVGMIPAMDPQVVILVIFDEPQGSYYASSVAAPVFQKIGQRIAQYLNIATDEAK
jgi:cell division protein FtsI (penicillin-binding protein 3)